MKIKTRVLCVDDDPNVLEGLEVQLRRGYEITPANNGEGGLDAIENLGPFAVVLSDMRMPGMNGAEFLARVRDTAPDLVRMLLTGYSDQESAIAAVNQGQIFRFLTKPCPPEQLVAAFDDAAEQHRLITAERVLLEQTLRGAIQVLTDVLALTNPVALGRANRMQHHVKELADRIDMPDRWQVEVAAMLSQIGCVTLPPATVERMYDGADLTAEEQEMINRLPEVTKKLLGHIPRLEPVLDILEQERKRFKSTTKKVVGTIPIGAHALRIAGDFDALVTKGYSSQLALDTMRGTSETYDGDLLAEFSELTGAAEVGQEIRELPFQAIQVGMVFAEDVCMEDGVVFVARGYEVTESLVERANNLQAGVIREPVRVIAQSVYDGGG